MGRECGMHGREEESVQGFGVKARWKETIRKCKAQMGEWDQNGSCGDWLGECRMDPFFSG
jgi:hypothetical protein